MINQKKGVLSFSSIPFKGNSNKYKEGFLNENGKRTGFRFIIGS